MANADYIMGSVSHGTLRLEDLIPCFVGVLENFDSDSLLVTAIEDRMEEDGYYDSEACHYDFEELFDALQEYALPYFYFGTHPGDGADCGFWLCDDVAELVRENGGYTTENLEKALTIIKEESTKGIIEVLYSNDHGNLTLYSYDIGKDKLTEIWAVV